MGKCNRSSHTAYRVGTLGTVGRMCDTVDWRPDCLSAGSRTTDIMARVREDVSINGASSRPAAAAL
ncbi:hypothetical protein J6590_001246 [Homalodisca vitripennis]|nr:hypothetical protein J6590_001246 [Homalodisca vitripennis]